MPGPRWRRLNLGLQTFLHFLYIDGKQAAVWWFINGYLPASEGPFLGQPHPRHASFADLVEEAVFAVEDGGVGGDGHDDWLTSYGVTSKFPIWMVPEVAPAS